MHVLFNREQLAPGAGLLLAAASLEAAGTAWTGSMVLYAAAAWHAVLAAMRRSGARWGRVAPVAALAVIPGAVVLALNRTPDDGWSVFAIGMAAAALGFTGFWKRRDLDDDFLLVELLVLWLPLLAGLTLSLFNVAWLDLLGGSLLVVRLVACVAVDRARSISAGLP